MEKTTPIVFDIGGSKMRVASIRDKHLDEVHMIDTPRTPEEGMRELVRLAKDCANGREITELVGDIAGVVKDGVVVRAPHLPQWDEFDMARAVRETLGVSLTLFNDAALVGLGEHYYGAGQHSKIMAYITVSTGVGGARIVDGHIDQGEYNPEIGHQLVNGEPLEDLISGSAVQKKYGVHPKDLKEPGVLEELAETLARGLYDNVLHWSPDTIVLGGSMMTGENAIPMSIVENTLEDMITTIYPHAPCIKKAKLSKLGGLYGGLAFLQHRV